MEKGQNFDAVSDTSSDGMPAEIGREKGRQFLGVHFACCDVYARVYANRQQNAYLGHCPRCARQVKFVVGEGGTDARFFTAQ